MFNRKLKDKVASLEHRIKWLEEELSLEHARSLKSIVWDTERDLKILAEALGLVKHERPYKVQYIKKGGPEQA